MNFTLIPFFIAVNITGTETDVWSYGPEYTFDVDITSMMSADLTEKPFFSSNITSTMKCRPKTQDTLLCRLSDMRMHVYDAFKITTKLGIEAPFEIRFNERGVEDLGFQKTVNILELNIVRSIATQLSVGADLKENKAALPAFVTKENFILGKCATLFTVLQYDRSQDRFAKEIPGRKWMYSLSVLTLPDRKPGSSTVIEKSTEYKRCTKTDEGTFNQGDVDIKIGRSFSKMQITGMETFRSQTEIHLLIKSPGPKDVALRDVISLKLTDVEPASGDLTSEKFEETASLFLSDAMQ